MAAGNQGCDNGSLGVRHSLLVYTTPRALFERVEDTGAYGGSLVTLLGLFVLMGYVLVQSGLIGQEMDIQTEKRLADLEDSRVDLVDRVAMRGQLEDARKQGEFNKTIARLGAIVLKPIYVLVSILLIASVLYAVVALAGRKPQWHTLMSICVYAAFIDLFAHGVWLAMIFYYRTLSVDTSLRSLWSADGPAVLAAVDPFRIWFWVLAGIGLTVTQQLSRRMAVVTCTLMCLVAMGLVVAMEFVPKG
ncbi:MAG: YIP1 family protein [Phycisphaerae bacterium]